MSNANPTSILGKIGKKVGEEVKAVNTAISTHSGKQDNPHSVNKTQVGLGNVENVALSTWAGSGQITTLGTVNSGTIPYNLLSNVPDVNNITGNLTIGGNLTVGGTTTTLNTETVLVEDNVIELNMGSAGAETAQTSGIQVNRGAGSSASLTETMENGYLSISYTVDSTNQITHIIIEDSNSVSTTYTFEIPSTGPVFPHSSLKGLFASVYNKENSNGAEFVEPFMGSDDVEEINHTVNSSGVSTLIASYSYNEANPTEDKATIIWDDNSGQATWKFGLGTADADIKAKDVVATGAVKVPDGNGLTINNVSIGDYAVFLSALTTAKA